MSIHFEDGEECRLRYLHVSYLAHALLAFLLFLQQFALAGDVAAVTFGGHVLADCLDGLAGDDFRSDGRLHCDVELLARDELFSFSHMRRPKS